MESTSDLVATWEVPLAGCVHTVEFEHGTTTGKRVIRVDSKVIVCYQRDSDSQNLTKSFKF